MRKNLPRRLNLVTRLTIKYVVFPVLFTVLLFLGSGIAATTGWFVEFGSWDLVQERISNADFTPAIGKILAMGVLLGGGLMLALDVLAFLEDKTKSLVSKILVLVIALSTMIFVVNQITEYFRGLGWYD